MQSTDVSSFAESQLKLLDTELQAELEETALLTSTHAPVKLQRAGLAVLNLTVSSQRTGFGGKTLLELELDSAVSSDSGELPEHGLRVGDICAVAEQPKGAERKKEREGMEKRGAEGVVTRVSKATITVALDKEEVDVPNGKLWLYVLQSPPTVSRFLLADHSTQRQAGQRGNVQTTQPVHGKTAEDAAFRAQHAHTGSLWAIVTNSHF